jgi:hypothetical protein
MYQLILAANDTVTVTGEELKSGWGSLIFTGLFFLALIVGFIIWLARR